MTSLTAGEYSEQTGKSSGQIKTGAGNSGGSAGYGGCRAGQRRAHKKKRGGLLSKAKICHRGCQMIFLHKRVGSLAVQEEHPYRERPSIELHYRHVMVEIPGRNANAPPNARRHKKREEKELGCRTGRVNPKVPVRACRGLIMG